MLSTTATGGLGYWKIGCRGSDPGLRCACAAPLAQPTPQPVKEFGAAPHAQAGLAPPPAARPPARLPLRRLTPWGPAGRPGQGRSVLASAAACPAAACRQWLAQASAFTFLAAAARFLAAASTMFTWPWGGARRGRRGWKYCWRLGGGVVVGEGPAWPGHRAAPHVARRASAGHLGARPPELAHPPPSQAPPHPSQGPLQRLFHRPSRHPPPTPHPHPPLAGRLTALRWGGCWSESPCLTMNPVSTSPAWKASFSRMSRW